MLQSNGGVPVLPILLGVIGISLSGVMMPGPVTAVTVAKSYRTPWAGAQIAIGHAVIEVLGLYMCRILFILGYIIEVAVYAGILVIILIDRLRFYRIADIVFEYVVDHLILLLDGYTSFADEELI